jgi:hypothetical protein
MNPARMFGKCFSDPTYGNETSGIYPSDVFSLSALG